MRELASGIDALYMSGHGDASPAFLRELEAHRCAAEEHGDAVSVRLGDGRWLAEPRGLLKCRYRLS